MHALLTALSLADHSEVHLFFAGTHVQLTLAVVGGAVAATHRLVGLHTLGRTHTLPALGVADCPERAVGTGLIYMEIREKAEGECVCVCQIFFNDICGKLALKNRVRVDPNPKFK